MVVRQVCPSDLEQRAGRIVRQGNKNKDVYIKRYVTDATFDAYLYQTVENKQKFISQIMTSKTPVRSCEDVDESVLSYAEIKALCAGDPLIKEKMELDTEVTRLKVLRSAFKRQQYRLEDMVQRTLPNEIKETQNHIARMKQDVAHLKEILPSTEEEAPFPVLKIGDTLCETRADAGKALRHLMSELQSTDPVAITTLYGFEVQLYRDSLFTSTYRAFLKGVCTYSVELGDSGLGNITRIENYIRAIPDMLDKTQNHLTDLQAQLAQAKEELGKPWAMEAEFQAKTARLTELDARLTLEDQNRDTAQAQDVEEERPSEPMSFADRLFHGAKQAVALNSQRTENQRQQPARQI